MFQRVIFQITRRAGVKKKNWHLSAIDAYLDAKVKRGYIISKVTMRPEKTITEVITQFSEDFEIKVLNIMPEEEFINSRKYHDA